MRGAGATAFEMRGAGATTFWKRESVVDDNKPVTEETALVLPRSEDLARGPSKSDGSHPEEVWKLRGRCDFL